jgi:hypothetical protein
MIYNMSRPVILIYSVGLQSLKGRTFYFITVVALISKFRIPNCHFDVASIYAKALSLPARCERL